MIRFTATMLRVLPIATMVLCAGAVLGSAAVGQESARDSGRRFERVSQREGDEFSQRYGVLIDNNIFLRDRRARSEAPTTQTTQPAPPPRPEKEWVLVGVVFEEGEFRAYFESVRGGGVKRAVIGDRIASGELSEVFIDSIGYSTPQGVAWIEIGQDLTGEYPVIPDVPRPAGTTSTPSQNGQPGAAPDTGAMSIEERLRQRRLQETGGARPGALRGAPQRGVPPQPGELPPGTIIEGDMIIVPAGEAPEGAEVEVLVVPQRVPPPADQTQRRPD